MSWVAEVDGYESPPALGKRAVGREAVDWTKMGSSAISLAETVTHSTSRRSSCVPSDFAETPLDESCFTWPSLDSAESLNDNTTSLEPDTKFDSFLLLLKNLEDKDNKSAPKADQSPMLYNHDDVLVACLANRPRHAALSKEPKRCSALI
jgi:hypothetical protein